MRTLPLLFVLLSLFLLLTLAACYAAAEPPVDEAASTGGVIVSALGCAGCHGADLSGAIGPNLTPDVATGLGAWSDGQIADAVRKGVDDEGASLCSTMPRFGTLGDEQAADLVAYLRSLPAKPHWVSSGCAVADMPSDAGLDDAGVVIVTDDAGGGGGDPPPCPGFAPPSTPAACHACSAAPCQANGCFGGYYCDLQLARCVPKPGGC